MTLAPYIPRPEEGLLEKCERIKRELQAAGRAVRHANDNDRPVPGRPEQWWQTW